MHKQKHYRPLPDNLVIRESEIEGLGLFAIENIPMDTNLGVSHYKFNGKVLRTPLGGFYNHSENPNCKKIEYKDRYELITLRDIESGEELTCNYTLYKI
jgi:SET domain-containing protein